MVTGKYQSLFSMFKSEIIGIFYDFWTWMIINVIFVLPFLFLFRISKTIARIWQITNNILIIILNFLLTVNFIERSTPYDHEFFTRKFSETWDTIVVTSGSQLWLFLPLIFFILLYLLLFITTNKLRWLYGRTYIRILLFLNIMPIIFIHYATSILSKHSNEPQANLEINKLGYFGVDSYSYFYSMHNYLSDSGNPDSIENELAFRNCFKFKYNSEEYPLLHEETSQNVLGPFFNLKPEKPNIVFLIIEGLSTAFSGKNAEFGSFTPFLDSLEEHSLYWKNCLSNSNGSFGVLPSTMGSLPYGETGFTNLISKYPNHTSMIKILNRNDYSTSYFFGGGLSFDNFGAFMRNEGVDFILTNFDEKYKRMPVGVSGFEMGYPDNALYSMSLETLGKTPHLPYLSVYFTLTTHSPFAFDQKPIYDQKFEQIVKNRLNEPELVKRLKESKDMFSSFLFSDDCIRHFFDEYKTRPEYNNTIFIITGDHHHGNVVPRNNLCLFNVPLIIYSPLLKKHESFSSINTHNNIPQTILALLKANNNLKNYPKEVHWTGDVLDTGMYFRNIHIMPLMQSNRSINEMIFGNYFIDGEALYKIKTDLNLEKIENPVILNKGKSILDSYNKINHYVCKYDKITDENESESNSILYKEFEVGNIQDDNNEFINFFNFELPLNLPAKIRYKLSIDMDNQIINEKAPILIFAIDDNIALKNLLWEPKDLNLLAKNKPGHNGWVTLNSQDTFGLNSFNNRKKLACKLYLWNKEKIKINVREIKVQVFFE